MITPYRRPSVGRRSSPGVVSAGDEWEAGWGLLFLSRLTGSGVVLPSSVCAPISALMESLHPEAMIGTLPGASDGVLVLALDGKGFGGPSLIHCQCVRLSTRHERVCLDVQTNPACMLSSSSGTAPSEAHPDATSGCSCALRWTSVWRASSSKIIAGSFASDEDRVLDASGRWRNSSDAHSALMRVLSERRWYPKLMAGPRLASVGRAQDHLRNPSDGRFLLELGF